MNRVDDTTRTTRKEDIVKHAVFRFIPDPEGPWIFFLSSSEPTELFSSTDILFEY